MQHFLQIFGRLVKVIRTCLTWYVQHRTIFCVQSLKRRKALYFCNYDILLSERFRNRATDISIFRCQSLRFMVDIYGTILAHKFHQLAGIYWTRGEKPDHHILSLFKINTTTYKISKSAFLSSFSCFKLKLFLREEPRVFYKMANYEQGTVKNNSQPG